MHRDPKWSPTRALGARIVTYDRLRETAKPSPDEILEETGGTLVPPFDHPMIMAGQGTTALELLEGFRDLDAVLICVGGGGLLAGCATIAKSMQPAIRIFGVEPENWQPILRSPLANGERVTIPVPDTIADGLRTSAQAK